MSSSTLQAQDRRKRGREDVSRFPENSKRPRVDTTPSLIDEIIDHLACDEETLLPSLSDAPPLPSTASGYDGFHFEENLYQPLLTLPPIGADDDTYNFSALFDESFDLSYSLSNGMVNNSGEEFLQYISQSGDYMTFGDDLLYPKTSQSAKEINFTIDPKLLQITNEPEVQLDSVTESQKGRINAPILIQNTPIHRPPPSGARAQTRTKTKAVVHREHAVTSHQGTLITPQRAVPTSSHTGDEIKAESTSSVGLAVEESRVAPFTRNPWSNLSIPEKVKEFLQVDVDPAQKFSEEAYSYIPTNVKRHYEDLLESILDDDITMTSVNLLGQFPVSQAHGGHDEIGTPSSEHIDEKKRSIKCDLFMGSYSVGPKEDKSIARERREAKKQDDKSEAPPKKQKTASIAKLMWKWQVADQSVKMFWHGHTEILNARETNPLPPGSFDSSIPRPIRLSHSCLAISSPFNHDVYAPPKSWNNNLLFNSHPAALMWGILKMYDPVIKGTLEHDILSQLIRASWKIDGLKNPRAKWPSKKQNEQQNKVMMQAVRSGKTMTVVEFWTLAAIAFKHLWDERYRTAAVEEKVQDNKSEDV